MTLDTTLLTKNDEGVKTSDSAARSKWLLRYILFVATLAFTGRSAPLAFLPLVLKDTFQQSDSVIGVVMAVYPFAALVTTPWAARLARGTRRIVFLHSWAIILVAVAMFLTSLAENIQTCLGTELAVAWVVLCRALQGLGASLYLSSNTSLITRKFPETLPYVIAMTEVAVGSGAQVGRLCGGFLFDLGGFMCPFAVIACFQGLTGIVGFLFEDEPISSPGQSGDEHEEEDLKHEESNSNVTLPWATLVTPRLCAGALGAFMMYFVGCFGDATLLQYLMVHLAPVSVGTLSVGMSSRGFTYLMSSFFIAQLMHGQLVSFERLISLGSFLAFCAQLIIAPQPFVTTLEAAGSGTAVPSRFALWATQIGSFVLAQCGGALMFVPSLPLMQSEVRQHGTQAVEQVAELFVTMMTLGEMLGPIFGGWLVGEVGFVQASLVLACLLVPLFLLSVCTYDSKVIRARHGRRSPSLAEALTDCEGSPDMGQGICSESCGPNCTVVPSDGEASFAWRRLPFAIGVKRTLASMPSSAPSSVFRRQYVPENLQKLYMTAPQNTRRTYRP